MKSYDDIIVFKFLVYLTMGIVISLCGVNGVGKSTQASEIKKAFNNYKAVVTRELFSYYFLEGFLKIRRSNSSPSTRGSKKNRKMLFKMWFLLAFIDIWVGHLVRTWKLKSNNDLVIADRDYSDIWVSLLYYGYMPKLAFKPLLRFLPKPGVRFVFLAKPEDVGKREKGFSKSYYKDQMRIYAMLGDIPGSVIVDSSKSKREVSKFIKRIIIRTL